MSEYSITNRDIGEWLTPDEQALWASLPQREESDALALEAVLVGLVRERRSVSRGVVYLPVLRSPVRAPQAPETEGAA